MTNLSDKKSKKLMVDIIVVAAVVGIIALVIFVLTYKRETHIIETYENGEASALVCSSNSNDAELNFFNGDDMVSVMHELKLVYSNGKVKKISYEFDGEYDSKKAAEHGDAVLHAKYNTYMGEHEINNSILTPVFQVLDNRLNIKLYLERYEDMNSVFGKLFYIGSSNIDAIGKNSAEETKKHYEKKGFSCIINE